MKKNYRVGVVGATGMVGQRFLTLLENHPWFTVTVLAASGRSAGLPYAKAVEGRWKMKTDIPAKFADMKVVDASDIDAIKPLVDFVFCAVNMPKSEIRDLETAYAKAEIPVVSNNSAHRSTHDVPMVIPEINDRHLEIIPTQRKRLGTTRGFIAVKPNCSIQSFVGPITALLKYEPTTVLATTYQAISGAGKTFREWPEMVDNIIPLISGEEEKTEKEPLKIWGRIEGDHIVSAESPVITSQCIRVPVTDGHTACVFISFRKKPSMEEIIDCWDNYEGEAQRLHLPSAPEHFITYFREENRPQAALDRDLYKGMGVSVGRLRPDGVFDYKFVGLSHNTLRGAAGGAVLIAELLCAKGYMD